MINGLPWSPQLSNKAIQQFAYASTLDYAFSYDRARESFTDRQAP